MDDRGGTLGKRLPSQVAPPSDSLQRIETKLHQAVLKKLPAVAPQVNGRISSPEAQAHDIIARQGALETHVKDADTRQMSQMVQMQRQLNQQGQQLHGAIESQNQNMVAMFENQMAQIRDLLRKRPSELDAPMD